MKVVLFCGGMGMRLREVSERVPKPMVTIGYRPILWNVMKYYAHFGHKDFILCPAMKPRRDRKLFLSESFVFLLISPCRTAAGSAFDKAMQ